MAVDLYRLQGYGLTAIHRLRRMGVRGGELYQTNRIFKGLCIATPILFVAGALFGGGGGATASSPAPPPLIVGPGGPVSSAAYQFGTPQAAPDPASLQRQQVFFAVYDSLKAEPQAGRRCDRLTAAAQALTVQDRGQVQPQVVVAIADADSCTAMIGPSDKRFAALAQAAAAYKADKTPATAKALSRAQQALTGFDLSREAADHAQGDIDLGQQATAQLQESDVRQKAFAAAVTATTVTPTLDARGAMAKAAEALTEFDQAGLAPSLRPAYATAVDLAAQYRESDSRIDQAVQQAGTPGQPGSEAEKSASLAAIGALTDLDWQRASPGQTEALNRARTAARDAALSMLVTSTPPLDGTSSAIADEQVARLRRIVGIIDPATLAPSERQALDAADRAAARIQKSDGRTADMGVVIDAWRKSPSPLSGGRVSTAYHALTDYDRSRFTAAQQAVFGQLEDAFYVVAGKTLGLAADTKSKIPLFVVAKDIKGGSEAALTDPLTGALGRAGYRLATTRAGAAMILELTAMIEAQNIIQTSTASLPVATVSATLRASWAVDGSEFARPAAKASASGSTADQAVVATFQRAAELLAGRFDQFVTTGARQ